MKENLIWRFRDEEGIRMEEWEGVCDDLAAEFLGWVRRKCRKSGQLVHIEADNNLYTKDCRHIWCFHVVSLVDGVVCDPWYPNKVLPLEEYLRVVFQPAEGLRCTIEGEVTEYPELAP